MSHTANITVHLAPQRRISALRVLQALLDGGWTFIEDDHISVLPAGDAGRFEWSCWPVSRAEEIPALVAEKAQQGECIGVVLFEQESMSGGPLLIEADTSSISLNITANRRTLPCAYLPTDFSWYIVRLIAAIEKVGVSVESIVCKEHG